MRSEETRKAAGASAAAGAPAAARVRFETAVGRAAPAPPRRRGFAPAGACVLGGRREPRRHGPADPAAGAVGSRLPGAAAAAAAAAKMSSLPPAPSPKCHHHCPSSSSSSSSSSPPPPPPPPSSKAREAATATPMEITPVTGAKSRRSRARNHAGHGAARLQPRGGAAPSFRYPGPGAAPSKYSLYFRRLSRFAAHLQARGGAVPMLPSWQAKCLHHCRNIVSVAVEIISMITETTARCRAPRAPGRRRFVVSILSIVSVISAVADCCFHPFCVVSLARPRTSRPRAAPSYCFCYFCYRRLLFP